MADDIVQLPGSRYARYALPIDYPPSRDLRPRWGTTHPPIAVLYDWFSAHAAKYDAFLDEMARSVPHLASIPRDFRHEQLPEPAWFGVPFAAFDTLALYTMVRLRRPQTYIEVGSGISTCFAAKAVRDHGLATRIVSIDPQPRAAIDEICDEVIREGLETCDLGRFADLRAGDIVFVDGSHRSFMNSDVTVFMIDVLPRLRPGVVVHLHDIMLPWDYPDMFVDWYWNEQYLLAAYMIGARDRLDPILPTQFVCRDPRFAERQARPFIDFGTEDLNWTWRGGGSMWFAHKPETPPLDDAAGRGRGGAPFARLSSASTATTGGESNAGPGTSQSGWMEAPALAFEIDLSRPIAGSGWHNPERDKERKAFRWTGPAPQFALRVRLSSGTSYRCKIIMRAIRPFVGNNLSIRVNHIETPYEQSQEGGRNELSFVIPSSEAEANLDFCEIVFRHEAVYSPAEHGSPDKRQLGFQVHSIEFSPLPGEAGLDSAPGQDDIADLTAKIQAIRHISNDEMERMGLDRVTTRIHEVLADPEFENWPLDRQLPMIQRVHAICTFYHHASGRSLIPALERLFHRALAEPKAELDALWLFYDLLFFLYWHNAPDTSPMRGFVDGVAVPFTAAIRRGVGCRALPVASRRQPGQEPLNVGYLSQFAMGPRDSVGQFAHHILANLARQFPGAYRLVLYAWSEYADDALAQLSADGVLVRRFKTSSMAERVAAVAEAIAADEIDILITDQNSWLPTVLFERRAAPVQIYYMMGGLPFWPLANIDAVFRIDVYDPRLDGFDPDKCFPMGLGPWDLPALAPSVSADAIAAERSLFPDGKRLIGVYGRLAKVTPEYLDVVGELLDRHPGLVAVLGGTGDGRWIREFAAARGLVGRLEVADRFVDGHVWGHMLEVFLDTFPTAGGVSRREVMAKGRPVVTMQGAWAQFEAAPMLVARDRRAYIEIVSRLLEDGDFYAEACAATRDVVARGMRDADYTALVADALETVVRRVRCGSPEGMGAGHAPGGAAAAGPGALTCGTAFEELAYSSVLDRLRAEAPSRISQLQLAADNKPVEAACADDVLYMPDLHLQVWRDRVVPSETDTTQYALRDLQESRRDRKTIIPAFSTVPVLEDDACVLTNINSHNFYHFLEHLYQVMILERSGFEGKYVLSALPGMSGGTPVFQREFLDLLKLPPDRIVHLSEPTLLRRAWFATPVGHTDVLIYPDVLFALREALLAAELPKCPATSARLWLAPRRRGIVNAEEVYRSLERYGFTVLDPGDLPVARQIAAVEGAEVLGGAHGAAMVHAMFLKPNSTVIECFSPHYINPCIIEICTALRHRYFQSVKTNSPIREYSHGEEIYVDLYQLEMILERQDRLN